jgi:hypothetical protein
MVVSAYHMRRSRPPLLNIDNKTDKSYKIDNNSVATYGYFC